MGKIRTKVLGNEELEKKQALEAATRRAAKKAESMEVEKAKKEKEVLESPEVTAEFEPTEEVSEKKEVKAKKSSKTRVRGKNYRAAKRQVTTDEVYTVVQAVSLLKKISTAKFDESVELHLNLVEAGIKGEVTLPHGTGKSVKVAVVTDELLTAIEGGTIDFDVLITHPSFMPKLAKVARVLGPKGLMPNPKNGTVSEKPEEVAKKYSGGALRFKSEAKFPLLHQLVGKKSFEDKQLVENIAAFIKAVNTKNIKSAYLKLSMTPSVQVKVD
ncbi:MAG: hypothetical protein WBO77_03190 [Microgenomates group bacterium]